MLPDRVLNPGPLTYESGALPIELRGPASQGLDRRSGLGTKRQAPVLCCSPVIHFSSLTTSMDTVFIFL